MRKLLIGVIFIPGLLQAQPKELPPFLTIVTGIEGVSYIKDIGDSSFPFVLKKNIPVAITAIELTLGVPKIHFYGQVSFSSYYYDNKGFNRSSGAYEPFFNSKKDARIFRIGYLIGLGGNVVDNRIKGKGVSLAVNAGLGAKYNITKNTDFTRDSSSGLSLLEESYGNSQTDLEINSRLKYNFHRHFGFVLGAHFGLSFAHYKFISKSDNKINPIFRYGLSLGLVF